MGTKENVRLEQLREQALALVEGDDPFRKEKVARILSADNLVQLKMECEMLAGALA